jgi:hypothetical protein
MEIYRELHETNGEITIEFTSDTDNQWALQWRFMELPDYDRWTWCLVYGGYFHDEYETAMDAVRAMERESGSTLVDDDGKKLDHLHFELVAHGGEDWD